MNETDRKYDWLKHIRTNGLIDDNINIVFLLVIWILNFKVVFWILLALTILNFIARGVWVAKLIKELRL